MICRHFLASVSPDAAYRQQTARLSVPDAGTFSASSQVCVVRGWYDVAYPHFDWDSEKSLPEEVCVGGVYNLIKAEAVEKEIPAPIPDTDCNGEPNYDERPQNRLHTCQSQN